MDVAYERISPKGSYRNGIWDRVMGRNCRQLVFLTGLYVLNTVSTRSAKWGKEVIRAFFIGEALIMLMYFFLFVLKGESKGEFTFAEAVLKLPQNMITWVTFIFTAILFILFLKQLRIRIRIKEVLFFIGLFVLTLVLIVIVEEIDRNLFWGNYPTIKIGDEVYN